MITANKAYKIAFDISGQHEKEEKEFKELERLIEERVNSGAFFLETRYPLYEKNIKRLQDYGYIVETFYDDIANLIHPSTHISWYKD